MATKIDDVKLYEIQTYFFHDAVITVQETAHKRTEIDKPDGPNEHGHMPSPTIHHDGSEHWYTWEHWEEVIAIVPLHFDYSDGLTEADKIKKVIETVDVLENVYALYPDSEISISWTMRRNCINQV